MDRQKLFYSLVGFQLITTSSIARIAAYENNNILFMLITFMDLKYINENSTTQIRAQHK